MTEAWAEEALALARSVGDDVSARCSTRSRGRATLGGRPVDDLCDRFRELTRRAPYYMAPSPERVAVQRLVWRGSIEEARDALTRLLDMADERGEPSSYALQRLHVCELELRAGGWDAAARLLDEWAESSDSTLLLWPMYERCRALLAVGRGRPAEPSAGPTRRSAAPSRRGRTGTGSRRRARSACRDLLAHEPESRGRDAAARSGRTPRTRA